MAVNVYADEVKAAAMAALLTGQSVSSVAKEYNIPRGTVAMWSANRNRSINSNKEETRQRIGELLLGYLEAALLALNAQVQVFSETDYLRKQPANEAAVLHGVIADKTIRLLEALAREEDADDQQSAVDTAS
jgi:transposase-like protein